jgi:hypothetical protein
MGLTLFEIDKVITDKLSPSSYAKSTWWIDLSATIHIVNSLHGFHMRGPLEEKEALESPTALKLKLKQLENFH